MTAAKYCLVAQGSIVHEVLNIAVHARADPTAMEIASRMASTLAKAGYSMFNLYDHDYNQTGAISAVCSLKVTVPEPRVDFKRP